MSRYIDADALYGETEKKIKASHEYRMAVVDDDFLDLINDAYTEDVVEVVRCKDCKHCTLTEDGEYNPEDIVCGFFMTDGMQADDFCSYGERSKG